MTTVYKGMGVLTILALVVMAGVCLLQYSAHAVERHGVAVQQTRSQFEEKCGSMPSATLTAPEKFLYLLFFPDNSVCVQFTDAPREEPQANELTTIPREQIAGGKQINRIAKWLANVVDKGGYTLLNCNGGDCPEWFVKILGLE